MTCMCVYIYISIHQPYWLGGRSGGQTLDRLAWRSSCMLVSRSALRRPGGARYQLRQVAAVLMLLLLDQLPRGQVSTRSACSLL
jgi:hypothetical protein